MMTDIDCTEAAEGSDRSTHTTHRMSTRLQRIEVITRGERWRRWSLEEKQAIVAESLAPHVSMMAIARKHGIGTGQLYGWRHQLLGKRASDAASFARVELASEPRRLAGPVAQQFPPDRDLLPGGAMAERVNDFDTSGFVI